MPALDAIGTHRSRIGARRPPSGRHLHRADLPAIAPRVLADDCAAFGFFLDQLQQRRLTNAGNAATGTFKLWNIDVDAHSRSLPSLRAKNHRFLVDITVDPLGIEPSPAGYEPDALPLSYRSVQRAAEESNLDCRFRRSEPYPLDERRMGTVRRRMKKIFEESAEHDSDTLRCALFSKQAWDHPSSLSVVPAAGVAPALTSV